VKAGGNEEVAGVITLVAGDSSHYHSFLLCIYYKDIDMLLSRQERERLVSLKSSTIFFNNYACLL